MSSIDHEEIFMGAISGSPGSSQTAASKRYRLCDPKYFRRKAKSRDNPKPIQRYYKKQAALLRAYQEDQEHLAPLSTGQCEIQSISPAYEDPCTKEVVLMNSTFACNIVLLVIKIIASVLSRSLSIISSATNSCVDCMVDIVIMLANWAIRNRDPYHYPRGRTRLQPLALVVVAVIMGILSVQVIIQSIESMIKNEVNPQMFYVIPSGNDTVTDGLDWRVMGIMISCVLIKLSLCIACCICGRKSPVIKVLAQEHLNDVFSNTAAIACGVLGQLYWPFIDSIGAILISIFIALSWLYTGCKQVAVLSGRTAPPYLISRIVKICIDHHEEIMHVDAVTVYHYGSQFIVEVDIVVNENMTVRQAHDISEPLQRKIEHLAIIERAFVHVEFQTKHTPFVEHKSV